MKYILTDAARDDIRQITRYIRIKQNSPQNARLVATRLRNHFRLLTAHPGMGHVREELQDDHLKVSAVTGLLIIYDFTSNPLTILRIIHPARDLGEVPLSE
jgi:plasmid stabilization system protein ParE